MWKTLWLFSIIWEPYWRNILYVKAFVGVLGYMWSLEAKACYMWKPLWSFFITCKPSWRNHQGEAFMANSIGSAFMKKSIEWIWMPLLLSNDVWAPLWLSNDVWMRLWLFKSSGHLRSYLLIKRVSKASEDKGRNLKSRIHLSGIICEMTSRQRFNGNAEMADSE